ncbi:hypothetical protein [Pseudonocardia sp. TRM90224]|uniref:hypothetical protein n=1 Tax=Pseudonocardia sp. TRM90224 TaxID=2812678 RepID=UPI001E447DEB|nr:hypothetical protein [Pseudonocardia sp. TRM90224]
MRTTYRVLAYLIVFLVVVQAAAIAYFIAGLGEWIMGGGVLDAATMESESTFFPGLIGIIIHGMSGTYLIPAVALALLVVAFFAQVPRGVMWAGVLVGLIAVQVALGIAHVPVLALLHGIVALAILVVALIAARAASGAPVGPAARADAVA